MRRAAQTHRARRHQRVVLTPRGIYAGKRDRQKRDFAHVSDFMSDHCQNPPKWGDSKGAASYCCEEIEMVARARIELATLRFFSP